MRTDCLIISALLGLLLIVFIVWCGPPSLPPIGLTIDQLAKTIFAIFFVSFAIERGANVLTATLFAGHESRINESLFALRLKIDDIEEQFAVAKKYRTQYESMSNRNSLSEDYQNHRNDLRLEFEKSEKQRCHLPNQKRQFAIVAGIVLGGAVALLGFRLAALGIDLRECESACHPDLLNLVYTTVDILFTAVVLSGCAEGLHTIVTRYAKDDRNPASVR